MAPRSAAQSLNASAKLAGFLLLFYIAILLAAGLVLDGFHAPGDVARTAANIRAGELQYRTGLVLQLLGGMTALPLGWAFYALVKGVDANLALLALLWRAAEALMGGLASVFRFMALSLYAAGPAAAGWGGEQPLVRLMLGGPRVTFPIAVIYFSIGSTIFFHLLLKSRAIPRVLAATGVIGSVMATILGFSLLIAPAWGDALSWLWAPMLVAEVGTALWLLIRGVDFAYWQGVSGPPDAPDAASSR